MAVAVTKEYCRRMARMEADLERMIENFVLESVEPSKRDNAIEHITFILRYAIDTNCDALLREFDKVLCASGSRRVLTELFNPPRN